jgi:hypothetical protein
MSYLAKNFSEEKTSGEECSGFSPSEKNLAKKNIEIRINSFWRRVSKILLNRVSPPYTHYQNHRHKSLMNKKNFALTSKFV